MSRPTSAPGVRAWSHRIASRVDAREGALRQISWERAQEWCNFVLFYPARLPAGLELVEATLRPEAPPGRPAGLDRMGRFEHGPSNRVTHQSVLAGPGCVIWLKQLLYDLGPPAFDHPSFWLSPSVEAFAIGPSVGWLGTEFHGHRGASVQVDRTTVELAVVEGTATDEELRGILRGLEPVSPSARRRILATPFAHLVYPARHSDPIITVPMGFWHHRRGPGALGTHPLAAEDAPPELSRLSIVVPSATGFELDSVILFGDPTNPEELEWIYWHREHPGQSLRILVWPRASSNPLRFPPVRDRQPYCTTRTLTVVGQCVYHAFADPRYGQHEAVWRLRDVSAMLLAKPTPWSDRDWFHGLLESVLAPP